MRGGSAWRLCLFAYLLSVGRADDSSRQHTSDNSDEFLEAGWKSGDPNNIHDNIDFLDGDLISPLYQNNYVKPGEDQRKAYTGQLFSSYSDLMNNYPYQGDDEIKRNPNYNLINPRQNVYALNEQEIVAIPPAIYSNNPKSDHNEYNVFGLRNPLVSDQQVPLNVFEANVEKDPLESVERDQNPNQELYMPLQPVVVPDVDQNGLNSKLVPTEDLVLIHKIPGASTVVNCSKVGEIYRFWQNGGDCLICVCIKEGIFKSVKPVCVSCAGCSGPGPYTTRKPFEPVTFPPPPGPSPDTHASCRPLPINKPFQSPLDPCKVCICSETVNIWGKVDATIRCERNPECVIPPDVTTLSPIPDGPLPLKVCDKFPINVIFPHPSNACRLCKCSVVQTTMGVVEQQINCYDNPDCQTPTEPVTEIIDPSNICNNYPVNTVFNDPHDLCRECQCYYDYTLGELGRKLQMQCRVKPECIPTPEPIVTLAPEIPQPVTCSPIPKGVPFQNPLNPCQVCVCTEGVDPYGRPDVYIKCDENQECVIPPEVTVPPIDIKPVPLPTCSKLPTNVPFPHPRDVCKTCRCTVQLSAGGPQEYISCFTNPDCEMTPKPYEPSICDRYPPNVLFPDPRDECRVCRCTLHNTVYGQTERHISCYVTPECSGSTISPVTLPPSPIPDDVSCAPLPTGVPFENPLHPCQVCVCRETLAPSGPDVQIECRENPHCVVPPEVTTVPSIDDNTPVPLPACAKYPPNVLFPHPRDSCRVCKCTVQMTSHGPSEYITCHANPECAPTPGPYIPVSPEPESMTCKPLPSGTPFQSPLNPCEICICKESVNVYGRPDVRIECQANPQCVVPSDVTIVPVIPDDKPVPLPVCTKYPVNVLFPHPRDSCRVCKCTVQMTSHGPSEYITCYANPDCETTPAPPAPWPPSPPGPLPGPSPHESCSPYTPSKPFQHPWDECQVCVCSEAISVGHITIEVNCFTKKSCCIEIPFDLSELPSSSTGPYIIRPSVDISGSISGSIDGSIAIGADGQQVNLREILDPNNIGHYLKPTGQHEAIIGHHVHGQEGTSGYAQNRYDIRNRGNNDLVPNPVNLITNQAQNQDLNNRNLYNQYGVAGYERYKIPGHIHSENVNSYKIPVDIRNRGNKYVSSVNGQVVVPGYIDQRYLNGPGVNTYVPGFGQEYRYNVQGNMKPGLYGGLISTSAGGNVDESGGLQVNLRQPGWMDKWSLGSVHGSAAVNVKGSNRMRTKSGSPDTSQSDEASGAE